MSAFRDNVDGVVTTAFLDALLEMGDAAQFERLMLGEEDRPPPFADSMARIQDLLDGIATREAIDPYDERSALVDLKGRLALERLQRRHPEVWDRVMLTGAVDG